jgi:hypothetical protein
MLCMGRLKPWDDSAEGIQQRLLVIEGVCDIATRFLRGGYGVVIDDVITPDDLPHFCRRLIDGSGHAHLVVLLPALEMLFERELTRPTEWRRAGRLEEVYNRFDAWAGVAKIHPASDPPGRVADRIMALAAEGVALLGQPEK